jgi:hypothetical protein
MNALMNTPLGNKLTGGPPTAAAAPAKAGFAGFIAANSGIFVAVMGATMLALMYLASVVNDFEPDVAPVDCVEGNEWTEWSDCTKACGGGIKMSFRKGDQPSRGDGKECSADINVMSCNVDPCNIDYKIGTWGAWGTCSAGCGPGTQVRKTVGDKDEEGDGQTAQTLLVSMGNKDGLPVSYDETNHNFYQTRDCNDRDCPVNCVVTWDTPANPTPGSTYLNPKYSAERADVNSPLYEPSTIPNPTYSQTIPNPLYDSMSSGLMDNPHYVPGDPNEPEQIMDPSTEPATIFNTDYVAGSPSTIPNPYFEPQYLLVPADPWSTAPLPKSDGYSYCKDDGGNYVQCGNTGNQTRTGTITVPPANGGATCGPGIVTGNRITETHSCNSACPIDCRLGNWIPVTPDVSIGGPYSCNPDTVAKDNLLRLQGWDTCSKPCLDITRDLKSDIGTRSRTRTSTAASNGGDACDPNDLIEEVECNNIRCPDIRDYLGGWKALSDWNHSSAVDDTDYMPFQSFIIYYNKNNLKNLDNGHTRETGFYSIYLNIDDKTNDFMGINTGIVLGKDPASGTTLQLYDRNWRMYDFVLETPTQLTMHMQNIMTHEEYDVCFTKFNNVRMTVPNIGDFDGWRYTNSDSVNRLTSAETGVPYEIALTAPLPTATDWVYQTSVEYGTDTQYAGVCPTPYNAPLSYYCPEVPDRAAFDFTEYLGKWMIDGAPGGDPVYYNIDRTQMADLSYLYFLHFDDSGGSYQMYERAALPHMLTFTKQTATDDEYITLHRPETMGTEDIIMRMTGYTMKVVNESTGMYDPQLLEDIPNLILSGPVSINPATGKMSFV